MEQQVNMVAVVSHISVLQALIAYFRRSPVHRCSSIQVPMHTVIKFTPVTGGGWVESQHLLLAFENNASHGANPHDVPIWGDQSIKRLDTINYGP
jgi:broad specificity phosphatase PhoE